MMKIKIKTEDLLEHMTEGLEDEKTQVKVIALRFADDRHKWLDLVLL